MKWISEYWALSTFDAMMKCWIKSTSKIFLESFVCYKHFKNMHSLINYFHLNINICIPYRRKKVYISACNVKLSIIHLMFLNIVSNLFSWMMSTEYILRKWWRWLLLYRILAWYDLFVNTSKLSPCMAYKSFNKKLFLCYKLVTSDDLQIHICSFLYYFRVHLVQSWSMSNSYSYRHTIIRRMLERMPRHGC